MSDRQLCQCNTGDTGIITKINVQDETTTRLQELGLLPGQWIQIVRSGNPIIFQIGESRYCTRSNLLQGITIQVVPNKSLFNPVESVTAATVEEMSTTS